MKKQQNLANNFAIINGSIVDCNDDAREYDFK